MIEDWPEFLSPAKVPHAVVDAIYRDPFDDEERELWQAGLLAFADQLITEHQNIAEAFEAARRRLYGSRAMARLEIAHALIGVLMELALYGMPCRFDAVMRAIAEGKGSADLFPDGLYRRTSIGKPQ